MTLNIGESWPAWHALARRAVWIRGDRTSDVLLFLSAQPVPDIEALQAEAQAAMRIRTPGVLPLLGVERVGEGAAWIYPFAEYVSPAFFTRARFGHRAAAELVRDAARVVTRHPHPGPRIEDLLLDAAGNPFVANFVGPLTPTAIVPGEEDAEAAAVYRLGSLLAHLLIGPFSAGVTPSSHDAAVRRAVIRAMSTPGAVFSDKYADWLGGMLAWRPSDRPPLSRVEAGLTDLIETSGGPTLQATVRTDFVDWMLLARQQTDDGVATFRPQATQPDPEYAGRTTLAHERITVEIGLDDEHTMESEFPEPLEHTPPSVLERGSIPVEVGPPAEAARARRPTLPPGFLDPQAGDTLPALPPRQTRPQPASSLPPPPSWWMPVGALLTGIALLLAGWLLFG